MITEKERQYRDELFKLMQENPELPVVPFVDADICWDDYGTYIGSWGSARVDEYIIPPNDDYVRFKSDDDLFYVLERFLSEEEFEALPENESDCRPIYDALPWVKAIVVNICTPEEPPESEQRVIITQQQNERGWVKGQLGKYSFSAKVYGEPSKYGINKGRVSKLFIWQEPGKASVVNYDRGWDIRPEGDEITEAFEKILAFLEAMPVPSDEP